MMWPSLGESFRPPCVQRQLIYLSNIKVMLVFVPGVYLSSSTTICYVESFLFSLKFKFAIKVFS